MNKKALEHLFGKLITWIALIFFLVIFLLAVFGEKGLLRGAAETALGLQNLLPQRQSPFKTTGEPPSVEIRDRLLELFGSKEDREYCAMDITGLKFGDLGGDIVFFDNDKKETYVKHKVRKGDKEPQRLRLRGYEFNVCFLSVNDKFYECYKNGVGCNADFSQEVSNIGLYKEGAMFNENLNINFKGYGVDYFQGYIFKVKVEEYCLLPVYSDRELPFLGSCGEPKAESGIRKFDTDCTKDLKKALNNKELKLC